MTSKNDITGDNIISKQNTEKYRENWDHIFNQKDKDTKSKNDEKEVDSKKIKE